MAFDAILTEQTAPITRRLLRMVGDRETAEDLRPGDVRPRMAQRAARRR